MTTLARSPEVWARTRYFDIQKHWRKLGPIFKSEQATKIWRETMWEFDEMRRGAPSPNVTPLEKMKVRAPECFDGCDWRFENSHPPAFWEYACHSACHWVVDLGLYVAKTAYPNVPWRILTKKEHTTAWNGSVEEPVLFDINFHALGIEPSEAMKLASRGRELKVGKYLKFYLHRTP